MYILFVSLCCVCFDSGLFGRIFTVQRYEKKMSLQKDCTEIQSLNPPKGPFLTLLEYRICTILPKVCIVFAENRVEHIFFRLSDFEIPSPFLGDFKATRMHLLELWKRSCLKLSGQDFKNRPKAPQGSRYQLCFYPKIVSTDVCRYDLRMALFCILLGRKIW